MGSLWAHTSTIGCIGLIVSCGLRTACKTRVNGGTQQIMTTCMQTLRLDHLWTCSNMSMKSKHSVCTIVLGTTYDSIHPHRSWKVTLRKCIPSAHATQLVNPYPDLDIMCPLPFTMIPYVFYICPPHPRTAADHHGRQNLSGSISSHEDPLTYTTLHRLQQPKVSDTCLHDTCLFQLGITTKQRHAAPPPPQPCSINYFLPYKLSNTGQASLMDWPLFPWLKPTKTTLGKALPTRDNVWHCHNSCLLTQAIVSHDL